MSESNDESPLFAYYRRYVGDPDRAIDVYAGFGLFFAGIALGLIGVVVFMYSATLPPEELSTYAVQEVAAVAAAIGLPALLFGVVVLLPVDRRMLYLAGVGTAITLVAVGLFSRTYPYNWNVSTATDYSAQVVAVYTVGLVAVIAATGGALVAHRAEQATGEATGTGDGAADAAAGASDDEGETVTDAEVRADIERELEDAELTWGGVERSETRRLQLDTSAIDDVDVDTEKLAGSATETRTTTGTVEDAVSNLKGLQGGEKKTASGEGTDDQAAALRELREQKRQNEAAAEEAAANERFSLLDWIRGLFR